MRKKKIKIQVETRVRLEYCSQEALDSFGSLESVRVNGDLDLFMCTGLTRLPEGLRVDGYLNLIDCTGIARLPNGLIVGGYLHLNGCTGLTKLPDDLHMGEKIFYGSETGFYGHEDEPGVIPERLKHKLRMV
jgi:hypothetical protein